MMSSCFEKFFAICAKFRKGKFNMEFNLNNINRYYSPALLAGILLTGGLARVFIFFQNRSFFLDEANLARNVVEKKPWDFFGTLDYEQYAPPLFLCIQKFNVWWLGASEYGVRFFPLLCGLFSLWLFYKLALRFIKPGIGLLFIFFIFSFSEYYLHFGTEGKQYASDVMFTLLLLNLALTQQLPWGRKAFFKWTLIGMITIWFSMPSVFVLAGVGIYFIIESYPEWKKGALFSILGMVVLWLASFALYYFAILQTDVESDYLQNYHSIYFLPVFPRCMADFQQYGTILHSILGTVVGHTVLALLTGLAGLIVGLFFLIRQDWKKAVLLLIPVAAVFLASMFHQYSLIPRLTLFFIPVLLLVIGFGIQKLFDINPNWVKIVVVVFTLITLSIHDGAKYLWTRYEIEEIRQVLEVVEKQHLYNDLLYINHSAKPAFTFYTQWHKNKANYHFDHYVEGDWRLNPAPEIFLVNEQPANRIWVIYSHQISESARVEKDKEMGVLLKSFEVVRAINFKGASAVLMERK